MPRRNTPRRPCARLRLEGLERRDTPATITVNSVPAPTATTNDYTVIQNAVNTAQPGDKIVLVGTFNFAERNAARSWARGADGRAGTFDDYSVFVPDGKTGITLTADTLGTAVIRGPGDLPGIDLESFLFFEGANYDGWTVSNLEISDFDLSVGMFADAGGAFDNVTITGNHIQVATDRNGSAAPRDTFQNIGIQYASGLNQTISNNQIDIPGDGLSGPGAVDFDRTPFRFSINVGIQSQAVGGGGLEGLAITGNTITVLKAQSARPALVIGIWENGNADNSDITVADNVFQNLSQANDPARNLEYGFWVTSQSNSANGGATVAYRNNTVSGAAFGFRYLPDQDHSANPTNTAVQFVGNTLTNVWGGFVVQSNGKARLSGNTLTGIGALGGPGVLVRPGSSVVLDTVDGANPVTGFASGVDVEGELDAQGVPVRGAAVVRDVALTGNGVGLLVEGGKALVERTDLRNNAVAGILARDGGLADAGQGPGGTDFTGLGTSAGQNNFTTGYAAGGAQAIADENTGPGYSLAGPDVPPGHSLTAQGNLFAQPGAAYIESVVRHDFDDPALGFVDYGSAAGGNDLAVTAAFATAPAFVNQQLTLLLTVTNFGPADAPGVTLTAPVPPGTTFVSAAPSQGTASETGGVVTADLGTLARGQTATVRVVVRPTAAGPIASAASVTATGVDPDPTNNAATATGTVDGTPTGVVKVKVAFRRLTLTGDDAANAVQVVAGPTPGSFRVIGLGGTQVQFGATTGGSADVSGVTAGLSSNLGLGDDTLIVDGSGTTAPLALTGSLTAALTRDNDTLYALHLAATGGLTATGGAGANRGTVAESTFGGGLVWVGAAGDDTLTVADTTVGRGFRAVGGAGIDRLDATGLVVNGGFTWSGGPGDNALTLAGSQIKGAAVLTGSTGADTAAVTGSVFGSFVWAGGGGTDGLSVADSAFGRTFAARGGFGTDTVTVARSTFAAGATFSGGPDVDHLDAGTRSGPPGASRGNSFTRTPAVSGFEDVQS